MSTDLRACRAGLTATGQVLHLLRRSRHAEPPQAAEAPRIHGLRLKSATWWHRAAPTWRASDSRNWSPFTSAARSDHIMRTTWVNGAGAQASYIWASGSIVVSVDVSAAGLTDDFLRRYLAKYPSSL